MSVTLQRQVDELVEAIMRLACEEYEQKAGDIPSSPFALVLGSDETVKVVPFQLRVDDQFIDAASTVVSAPKQAAYLEQVSLSAVRLTAARFPPGVLVGVGYMFPARGDFPSTDQEVAMARLLRSQGLPVTPWSMEGLVLVLDGPDGRKTWAATRPQGEVADPLSSPGRRRVEVNHVVDLYPHQRQHPQEWD